MASHVFISYVTENRAIVDRLRADLDAAGVKTWIHDQAIGPGEPWKKKIRTAIREGDFFVACFSRESIARDRSGMNEELMLAIDELRLRAADRTWFIPLKLNDCDIPDLEIGGGTTLADLQYVPLYQEWEKNVGRLVAALKKQRPAAGGGTGPSRTTALLALLTLIVVVAYVLAAYRSWPAAFASLETRPLEQESAVDDAVAIDLLAEALAHTKADRLADAHQSVLAAAGTAKSRAVQDRAEALRLLLAISLSEGHQLLGETLVRGRGNAAERDQVRYAELAVGQSMQSFKWARSAAEALDALSGRGLPQPQFSKIELSDAFEGPSEAGLEVSRRIESGREIPSQADLDRTAAMLTAQVLRFYVSKALHPEGDKVEVMTRDLWSGQVSWSADLLLPIHQHLTKMADKGARMVEATLAQPQENRFSVGDSFGLGQTLDYAFCKSLLDSLARFLERARSKASQGAESLQLAALLQDVDRRQLRIAQMSRSAP